MLDKGVPLDAAGAGVGAGVGAGGGVGAGAATACTCAAVTFMPVAWFTRLAIVAGLVIP